MLTNDATSREAAEATSSTYLLDSLAFNFVRWTGQYCLELAVVPKMQSCLEKVL